MIVQVLPAFPSSSLPSSDVLEGHLAAACFCDPGCLLTGLICIFYSAGRLSASESFIPGAWEEEGFKILRKYGVEYCDRSVSMYEAAGRAVAKMDA